jgi:hypothetical protein
VWLSHPELIAGFTHFNLSVAQPRMARNQIKANVHNTQSRTHTPTHPPPQTRDKPKTVAFPAYLSKRGKKERGYLIITLYFWVMKRLSFVYLLLAIISRNSATKTPPRLLLVATAWQ